MPTNITFGNSAQFVVEFLSSAGALIVPSSGNLTLTYNAAGVSQVAVVPLTQQQSFFTGTWSSTGADLGLVTWVVSSSASASPANSGQLRIISE